MKFTSKQDINAPIEHVFHSITDFDYFESYAMRMGAQVERKDSLTEIAKGMAWDVDATFRGKHRHVEITIDDYNPTDGITYHCVSDSLDAHVVFQIIPLSLGETRMKVVTDLKPKKLTARLAIQSARLAKKTLNRKFNSRMRDFANHIANKYHG